MPKRLPLELRDLAKTLYLQGISPVRVAAQTGVRVALIHQWANRHGWTATRDKVLAKIDRAVNTVTNDRLTERSNRVRDCLVTEVERAADRLNESKIRGPGALAGRNGRAAVLKTLADTSDKLFGWSKQENTTNVFSVTVLNDLRRTVSVDTHPESTNASDQTIDVESQAVDSEGEA